MRELERIGYTYIALGGLASLPTADLLACVEAAGCARRSETRLHLLGVARLEHVDQMIRWGVVSFDTTMPLRQAFKDDRHNYHTLHDAYLAIRVPQVVGNEQMKRRLQERGVSFSEAKALERRCLTLLRGYDTAKASLSDALEAVQTYELLFNGREQTEAYGRLLSGRPWKSCPCAICQAAGIDVVLLRGRERNKRRGFHNLYVLHQRLQNQEAHGTAPN